MTNRVKTKAGFSSQGTESTAKHQLHHGSQWKKSFVSNDKLFLDLRDPLQNPFKTSMNPVRQAQTSFHERFLKVDQLH